MAGDRLDQKINALFDRGAWAAARKLLRTGLKAEPDSHWLLTQLGVTYYEQRDYEKALRLFLESWRIVPDCPLTLWHLAGVLDALGKYAEAKPIYSWILRSRVAPRDDPCWEDEAWTERLKADTTYRLGLCLQRLGQVRKADRCFREYLNLLCAGISGSYSADDVASRIRSLNASASVNGAAGRSPTRARRPARRTAYGQRSGRRHPPRINAKKLLAGLTFTGKRAG